MMMVPGGSRVGKSTSCGLNCGLTFSYSSSEMGNGSPGALGIGSGSVTTPVAQAALARLAIMAASPSARNARLLMRITPVLSERGRHPGPSPPGAEGPILFSFPLIELSPKLQPRLWQEIGIGASCEGQPRITTSLILIPAKASDPACGRPKLDPDFRRGDERK